jgi:hypothetical protein
MLITARIGRCHHKWHQNTIFNKLYMLYVSIVRALIEHLSHGLGPRLRAFREMKPSHEPSRAVFWAWLRPGFKGLAWPSSGLLGQAGTSLLVAQIHICLVWGRAHISGVDWAQCLWSISVLPSLLNRSGCCLYRHIPYFCNQVCEYLVHYSLKDGRGVDETKHHHCSPWLHQKATFHSSPSLIWTLL